MNIFISLFLPIKKTVLKYSKPAFNITYILDGVDNLAFLRKIRNSYSASAVKVSFERIEMK